MIISVCMAAFNGQLYIENQINSILRQLKSNDELIIVDDCSTDKTIEVIERFRDKRIRLLINPSNKGVAATFSRAIEEAVGEIIFLSDQDDRWHDNKISTVLNVFSTTNIDLIVHNANVIINGKTSDKNLFEIAGSSSGIFKNIFSNTYTGCCMAFNKRIIKNITPIANNIEHYHDAWIGVLSEYYKYKVEFIPVPLIDFYRHGNNLSSMKRRKPFIIIKERLKFIFALMVKIVFRIPRLDSKFSRQEKS